MPIGGMIHARPTEQQQQQVQLFSHKEACALGKWKCK